MFIFVANEKGSTWAYSTPGFGAALLPSHLQGMREICGPLTAGVAAVDDGSPKYIRSIITEVKIITNFDWDGREHITPDTLLNFISFLQTGDEAS